MINELVEYRYNNKIFCAYVARAHNTTNLPVVLICHAWAGRDDFANQIADRIAKLGYCGIALDVYGKDILGNTVDEKMSLMQPLLDNREELQGRLKAAFEKISSLNYIDSNKIAAIGYCFGGLCVLDMARIDLNLRGVVSVHGNLTKPSNLQKYIIKNKVLALHGYLDPLVTKDHVDAFMQECDEAKTDWQLYIYGKAVHGFSNPEAMDHNLGIVYDKTTEERSWLAICNFLRESFL